MTKDEKLSHMPYITQDGDDREAGDDQYIKNVQDGCIIGYKYFDFSNNNQTTTLKVNIKGSAQGIIAVTTDTDYADKKFDDYHLCAKQHINISDDDHWTSTNITFKTPDSIKPVYFMFRGNGTFCIKDFEFLS